MVELSMNYPPEIGPGYFIYAGMDLRQKSLLLG
jgi:hypothetical protein